MAFNSPAASPLGTAPPTLSNKVVNAFHYLPNQDVAWMWFTLFLVISLVIWAQIHFLYKSRFYYIIVGTGFMEVVGYGLRVRSAQEYDLMVFIVTSLCLLVAPILLAFVNYLVAGWLVMAAGRRVHIFCFEVSATKIAKVFLASDLVCLFLQGAGGGMLAAKDINVVQMGNAVVLAGLAVQITFFTAYFYIVLRIRFEHEFKFKYVPSLKPLFQGLILTVLLMYVRNVYRILDFGSIAINSWLNPGYIPANEWTFFAFESSPIFLAFCVYAALPFNKYLGYHQEHPVWKEELAAVNKTYGFDSEEAGGDGPGALGLPANDNRESREDKTTVSGAGDP